MDNEMIERVKKAIADKFAPAIDFKAPYAKVMLDVATKDVIKAMREPTMEMTMKGNLAIAAEFGADLVFKNMIDAIINE